MRNTATTTALDPSASQPLYVQLAGVLRSQIISGTYEAGDRIPTTAELSKKMGVSTITVNQAVAELVREGLLSRRPRLGTFVTGRAPEARSVAIVAPLEPKGTGGDGFIMRLFRGLKAEFTKARCAVTLVPCATAAEFASAAPLLRDAGALAVVGPVDAPMLRAVKKAGKPAVVLDTPGADEFGLDSIVVDNVGLACTAVTELLKASHRRILYHGMGPQDPDNDKMRLAGYKAALKKAGVRFSSKFVVPPKNIVASKEIAAGLRATKATALFLSNAGFYNSALRALGLLGYTTPADVSIACFGGATGVPKPAGVSLDPEEMGARAAQRLIKRIDDDSLAPVEISVPGWFSKGETLAPPAKR